VIVLKILCGIKKSHKNFNTKTQKTFRNHTKISWLSHKSQWPNKHTKFSTQAHKNTQSVLLDVEKAFDSVWHKTLLHKLLRGCDIFLARLIFSFIKGRFFQVSVGSAKSSAYNIPFGVPQGAILSPTLYNIFTPDVPSFDFCGTATFADDTAILPQDKLHFWFKIIYKIIWTKFLIIARIGQLKSTRQKRKQFTFLDAPKMFLKLK
jgi:Reverse transcriptase (RNA-dependent DNA polymerase)